MPTHATAQYPFRWHDGSYHSRPEKQRPAATTPTPAAPAPVGQHLQPDSTYNATVDLADRQLSQTNTGLDAQEAGIKFDYGIDDPTNPNSRAAALKRAYLARANADTNGSALSGHLYSSSHQRAVERTRRDQEFANADLRRNYEAALQGVRDARTQAGFANEQAKLQAGQDLIDRAPAATAPIAPPAPPRPQMTTFGHPMFPALAAAKKKKKR